VDDHERAQPTGSPVLTALVTAIQRRWGAAVLQRGARFDQTQLMLSTGHPELDALLAGGVPRRAMTELLGMPTSGMTTLALTLLGQTQAEGAIAVWVDLSGSFDAAYAAACGVDLAALLLVQPTSASEALVASGAVGVLVIDALAWLQATASGRLQLGAALRRFSHTLTATPCALVALTYLPYPPAVVQSLSSRGSVVAQAAALRLHVARVAWDLAQPLAPAGRACVTVLHQRGRPSGAQTHLTIRFPDDTRLP
jgi:hypothetical protein